MVVRLVAMLFHWIQSIGRAVVWFDLIFDFTAFEAEVCGGCIYLCLSKFGMPCKSCNGLYHVDALGWVAAAHRLENDMLYFIEEFMTILLCKRIVADTNEQLNMVRWFELLMTTANSEQNMEMLGNHRLHLDAGAFPFTFCPPFACAAIFLLVTMGVRQIGLIDYYMHCCLYVDAVSAWKWYIGRGLRIEIK